MSSTSFKASSRGRLDLARAVAIGGSYQRGAGYSAAWGMGVIATMQPTKSKPGCCYFWGGEQRFTVSVHAHGRTLATRVFRRRFSARPLRLQHTTLSGDGFIGDYWSPSSRSGERPAILAFGGSEGGESTFQLAALLAAHGYPTLALAYFKEPGLPQTLSNIPLEYFAKALTWLAQEPQVDPNRILTLGISRGSEAALLLGVHYPNLVHGAIATVPANVALCSYPGCGGPAWTLGGQPLPYTRQVDQPHPTDDPAAVIPVEQIAGPIFLDCAGRDEVWPSCPYSNAIIQRLDAHHDQYRHVLLRFPSAGHLIGTTIPYDPNVVDTLPENEQARERIWPQLLSFLAHQ
jgi:dienelactone hydrolase